MVRDSSMVEDHFAFHGSEEQADSDKVFDDQGIFNSRTDALQASDEKVKDDFFDISRSSRPTR